MAKYRIARHFVVNVPEGEDLNGILAQMADEEMPKDTTDEGIAIWIMHQADVGNYNHLVEEDDIYVNPISESEDRIWDNHWETDDES